MDKNNIILGSGNLYIAAYSSETGIPADEVIESETKVKDDTQYVVKRFIQSEEVSFKSGVLTWDMANLEKLAGACTKTTDNSTNKTTIKVGGRGSNGLTPYVIRFVHKDDVKELRITLVGTAANGFSLAFNPDKETVVDAEFSAMSSDDDGTLVIVEETPVSGSL